MLCFLGPKKSLTSPRLELTAQGVAYRCSKVECEGHSSIQAPNDYFLPLIFSREYKVSTLRCLKCKVPRYELLHWQIAFSINKKI